MSSVTTISTSGDVIAFLKAQHEQVKHALADVKAKTGTEREQAFVQLRQMLAVHETAEELIVHPRAKHEIPNGDEVVQARLDEEHEAKETLAKLEKMDVDSAEFDSAFDTFHTAVLAHAEAEEVQEFAKLETEVDAKVLDRMRRAVEGAEALAPTRPHPAAGESRAANLLVGPFAAMVDRARDAMTATK